MNCMVFDGFKGMRVWLPLGACSIHNLSSLSWAMHVHILGMHVNCNDHSRIVMSWGQLCWLPTFTRV